MEGVLYKGTTSFLVGPPKRGKTFLMVDLVGAVLTGRRWQGFRTEPDPVRPVVIFAGEGLPEVPRRLTAWAVHHGYDPADLLARVVVLPGGVPLHDPAHRGAVVEVLADLNPQLVVVDTFARHLVGGDENAGKDVGQYTDTVESVAQRTCAHVMTVHHTGKDASRGGRGHSSIEGSPETELTVSGESPNLKVTNTAQRTTAQVEPWLVELVKAGENPDTGEHLSLVAVPRAGGPTADNRKAEEVLDVLRYFGATSEDRSVPRGEWLAGVEERVGIGKTTFGHLATALLDAGRVLKGDGHRGRYWLPPEVEDHHEDPLSLL